MNEPSIDDLAQRLLEAKESVKTAQSTLYDVENAIVDFFGAKEEGTENFEGFDFTLQTVGTLTRKIATEDIYRLQAAVPKAVFDSLIKVEPKLSVSELKRLERTDPESYREAMRFISVKPAKTAVKVKPS